MNLWQLKKLVAVIEHKSFSKASAAINLSQPTVSSHIRELEEYFQCPLLDRLGKITKPTRTGEIVYQHEIRCSVPRNPSHFCHIAFPNTKKNNQLN